MALFSFLRQKKTETVEDLSVERGILVFDNTSEVIRAESVLTSAGWPIKVMGPPPEIRSGCDLVIEIPLMEELNILRTLEKAGASPLETVPVSSPLLQPVDLFQTKDYGQYRMIRAANMKLTICKKTLTIVNISGGGCPDVPYLAEAMVGKKLDQAPGPRQIGHTLCGYALQLAYEEMKRQCLP